MLLLAIKGLHVRPDKEVAADEPVVRMKDVLSTKQTHLKAPSFSDELKPETNEKKEYLFGYFNQNGDFYMNVTDLDLAQRCFKPVN